jgi:hypothetical protein
MEQQELNKCLEFINNKNSSGMCSYCNTASDLYPFETDIIPKGDNRPLIAITCTRCGKVSLFYVGNQNTNI